MYETANLWKAFSFFPHATQKKKCIWQQGAWYNKQIFHAFLFNIRNYSPEVINIQRHEAELNIVLPRVNNFDIKQKKAWNICFIIYHQHQTRSGKIKTNKTLQILVKAQAFFIKTEVRHI